MGRGCYGKGARAERELIIKFSGAGFSVIRAAGSGVNSLSPDLLAFRQTKQYAFESKAWDRGSLALEKEQYEGLKRWEENTGITTLIAWRRSREGWAFFHLGQMEEQGKTFTISWKKAQQYNLGMDFLLT